MFQGVYTAIITPFKNDKVDYDSYNKLLEKQIKAGVNGVVPCGTTGESPTLSHAEHAELIRETVKAVQGKIQVVAGTGSNSTREAIELTEAACKDGVDGILSVNPYYNKPTQEGLFQHFQAIAEHSSVPVMLYNIPGRTSVNLQPETVLRLSEVKRIRSMKEATGDLGQMGKLISLVGNKMTVLSGDDNLTLPLLAIGGVGVVSVVSNLYPKAMVEMVKYFQDGKITEARKIHYDFIEAFALAFMETNPIPIKAAMAWFGYCEPEIRLPLTRLSQNETSVKFKKTLETLKEKGYE
ncbi:4-hydroxy-tetrahydrodipicolinate synthase [Leptospira mayottensis]|uniref:4-hydroxy-tetrahydrodipicolinate synthase n=2 Tax=Leptospira mayottensis TaxID=1137606 RepID=A0AA87SVT1_9LEPT|nr:4-hydroxy-tetrahydrodipicolinate synthase [Leptospira mayottensis]AXR60813.1 4-hydroxy-tetrahydrodipicolinate synthase [Leptospira mayottensis]AXR64691.1 4-hydroxy-tetrahydrodipicolinate synthase [Leptospira mayottensis]AXR68392.1 4-hydroxy-tetrahydrodipicolinate synthase [Leptospira mayottensis]AZQ02756.1 4-hydroxy-tetrahydrodipicolinate synthase [Leptospira mayottensis 200901116]EKR98322.1 dihydrodipicolinate synthase [Leptospira mayottensis 200901122]